MNQRGRVFVELQNGKPIRIFRNRKVAAISGVDRLAEWPRADAIRAIREQIFARSGGYCERCSTPINLNAHMHEQVLRGKGGEYSLTNCTMICADCHTGKHGAHGNRRPRFGEEPGPFVRP